MTADNYLHQVLFRNIVDMGARSPLLQTRAVLLPLLQKWAGNYLLSVAPSGSFAKGTAVRTGTDIDLFISLAPECPNTLKEIHDSLTTALRNSGFNPRSQTVSIGVRAGPAPYYDVDLVPAKKRDTFSDDHSLYHRKSDTARKTNVRRHVAEVVRSGRQDEIRLLKIWRQQHHLEFPSFYLELTVIAALAGRPPAPLSDNVWQVFMYLRDRFLAARVPDPAVPTNAVSDDLTIAERMAVKNAAAGALARRTWQEIIV